MLTKEEFIKEKLAKATKVAEAEWEKRFETKPATKDGVEFARWMKQKVSEYAEQANKDMEIRYRLYSLRDESSIKNIVYAFLLHILRRNCDLGAQLKSIEKKDVAKAREIVEHVINMCASEPWRKEAQA